MAADIFYGHNIAILDSLGNEKKRYRAENVARGIERFVEDNFRGLAETSIELPSDAEMFINIESLAMFFTEVLNFVMGRALLKMRFYSERGKIIVRLFSDPPLPYTVDEAKHFIAFARDVGFDLCRIDGDAVFIIDCFERKKYTVYAPPFIDNVKIISQVFENVFYRQNNSEKQFKM